MMLSCRDHSDVRSCIESIDEIVKSDACHGKC